MKPAPPVTRIVRSQRFVPEPAPDVGDARMVWRPDIVRGKMCARERRDIVSVEGDRSPDGDGRVAPCLDPFSS